MAVGSRVVKINLDDAKVEFEGVWNRADLDRAYRLMLRDLAKHYMEMRRKDAEAKAEVEAEDNGLNTSFDKDDDKNENGGN